MAYTYRANTYLRLGRRKTEIMTKVIYEVNDRNPDNTEKPWKISQHSVLPNGKWKNNGQSMPERFKTSKEAETHANKMKPLHENIRKTLDINVVVRSHGDSQFDKEHF